MIILGLTGSIGMGKSVTAGMFRDMGVPVHDSDSVVHGLYEGEAVSAIAEKFPQAIRNGIVDRQTLGKLVIGQPEAMRELEAIVHPLVAEKRREFLDDARKRGCPLVVLDIPLLFETGSEKMCDKILVVTAPAEVQRERVLSRPGMTVEKFERILAPQTADGIKRKRADYLLDTSRGLEHARATVAAIVRELETRDNSDA
jgi:dephospho-CoA kinase